MAQQLRRERLEVANLPATEDGIAGVLCVHFHSARPSRDHLQVRVPHEWIRFLCTAGRCGSSGNPRFASPLGSLAAKRPRMYPGPNLTWRRHRAVPRADARRNRALKTSCLQRLHYLQPSKRVSRAEWRVLHPYWSGPTGKSYTYLNAGDSLQNWTVWRVWRHGVQRQRVRAWIGPASTLESVLEHDADWRHRRQAGPWRPEHVRTLAAVPHRPPGQSGWKQNGRLPAGTSMPTSVAVTLLEEERRPNRVNIGTNRCEPSALETEQAAHQRWGRTPDFTGSRRIVTSS
jgi:hypothetical protein